MDFKEFSNRIYNKYCLTKADKPMIIIQTF